MIHVPGQNDSVTISGYVSDNKLTSGPVWVVAGSGLRHGTLNANPASVYLWGSFYNVKQIALQDALGKSLMISLINL
jgi:hypothetical protein